VGGWRVAGNMKNRADLVQAILSIKEREALVQLFNELFTGAERSDLMLRWELMARLMQKVPQRQISRDLGISLCKITRGSKILSSGNSVCKSLLEKQIKPKIL
jgi:TrpR family transcriptional regulator, trp operon repressor